MPASDFTVSDPEAVDVAAVTSVRVVMLLATAEP
jgi:hypothetical protein